MPIGLGYVFMWRVHSRQDQEGDRHNCNLKTVLRSFIRSTSSPIPFILHHLRILTFIPNIHLRLVSHSLTLLHPSVLGGVTLLFRGVFVISDSTLTC
eukprot:scaffold1626_cov178-Alexandrium_tamarense.AAC.11